MIRDEGCNTKPVARAFQPVDLLNETLRSEFPLAAGIELEIEDLDDLKRMMTVRFIVYLVDYELAGRVG